jgi:hypothetical protein
MWWYPSVIPALRRLKQKDSKFKASLGYRMSFRPVWVTKQDTVSKKQKKKPKLLCKQRNVNI